MEMIVKRVMEELRKIDELKQREALGEKKPTSEVEDLRFPVEASARHVHLSQSDVEALFGKGYQLTFARELSQPNQYLAKERITLIGSKGVIENVAVLGPARTATQIEVSITDCRSLGVIPVLRESGKISGTPGIALAYGGKALNLETGVMVAKRHIHMSPENAVRLNVTNGQKVKVKIHSERPVVLEDVVIRISPDFNLSMHIDLDEANACALEAHTKGEIL